MFHQKWLIVILGIPVFATRGRELERNLCLKIYIQIIKNYLLSSRSLFIKNTINSCPALRIPRRISQDHIKFVYIDRIAIHINLLINIYNKITYDHVWNIRLHSRVTSKLIFFLRRKLVTFFQRWSLIPFW